jgi:hypothetical protein
VLAAGQQPAGVPGDAEHLTLNPVQYGGRENHFRPSQPRPVEEAQQGIPAAAEHLPAAEGDDVTPEDVAIDGEAPDVVKNALRHRLVRGTDLDVDSRDVSSLIRPAEQQRDGGTRIADEVQAALDAGEGLIIRARSAGG